MTSKELIVTNSICVFGDSTAWGAWDLEKGSWVNRIWLYVGKRNDDGCEIYNLSISGGTTETILKRFESEAKIRGADGIIFQSGGNDSCLQNKKNGPNLVSLDQFKKNLKEIIKRARKITPNIIFVGLNKVDEAKTMPVFWRDIYYVNSEIKKNNEIMSEICEDNGILYLDVFGKLKNKDLNDGVHPNTNGHEKIFVQVKDFLIKNKWI